MAARLLIAVLLLLTGVFPAVADDDESQDPITISFEESAVVAEGLKKGESALLFGISRERPGPITTVVRHEVILVDEDHDGIVTYELGRALPLLSVWAFVDLKRGRFSIDVPPGSPRREVLPAPQVLVDDGTGSVRVLQDMRGTIDVVLARRKEGAWGISAGCCGSTSGGGPNDRIEIVFADMRPIGDSPAPPQELHKKDVIIVIDGRRMQFYAIRFGDDINDQDKALWPGVDE